MDDKIIKGIINHVKDDAPVPKGVTIKSIIDIQDLLTKTFEKEGAKIEFKESVEGLYPVSQFAIVTDEKERGIISLPTVLVIFEFDGTIEHLEINNLWLIVGSVDTAFELRDIVDDIIFGELEKFSK